MSSEPRQQDLPYIDQHAVTVGAPRAAVWAALERYADKWIGASQAGFLCRLLGTEPPSGFGVAEREPERRLMLAGRHRFARYRLVFELSDGPRGDTVLRALTYAVFPGLRGLVYRTLVLGTRLHVVATRGMLHAVRRRSTIRSSAKP